jgi:phosphatidylglycerol lysyltransferase
LYGPVVEHSADLELGVLTIAIAFGSGLAGWTLAAILGPSGGSIGATVAVAGLALVLVYVIVFAARLAAVRFERFDELDTGARAAFPPAAIGWLDWMLASLVFAACLKATGAAQVGLSSIHAFFFGQVVGIASLVPGGFGSSDAFWIARLPLAPGAATAALIVYRLVYYIVPWAAASLVLLSWATRRTSKRVQFARRLVAGLVAAGGVLILLSTGSPALEHRLRLLEEIVPLPVVEVSHFAAAMTGLLLLVLARGLAKGYRGALSGTVGLLVLAAISSLLKGFDYEEALILVGLALAAWSQSALFDRASHGELVTGRDVAVAVGALIVFLGFGIFTHRIGPQALGRIRYFGYGFERARYLRTASTLAIAVVAGALYVVLRVPVRFSRLREEEIDRALELNTAFGSSTSQMTVANGDKALFEFDDRGFVLYRTVGPYLVVFSDPVVASPDERNALLDALFDYSDEIDRRPIFYQVSLEWIPPLHDRGYAFFKLGEEAHVPLKRVTLDGHAGKMYRQVLRRAERDRLRFRIVAPYDIPALMPELRAISDDWLAAKRQRERQFSIGFFDEGYMKRFPCAVVEQVNEAGAGVLAFANVLRGPRREEMSIDLMRYRSDGPSVMDFLFVSLLLHAKEEGYKRFNLGMAPLASVGRFRGAHARERLANLLFQHGENWYNFQGLRFYKEKFEPDWIPRYMAYQSAWEWPAAITNVSALVAGGWARIVMPRLQGTGDRDQGPGDRDQGPGIGEPGQRQPRGSAVAS